LFCFWVLSFFFFHFFFSFFETRAEDCFKWKGMEEEEKENAKKQKKNNNAQPTNSTPFLFQKQ